MSRTETILTSEEMDELQMLVDEIYDLRGYIYNVRAEHGEVYVHTIKRIAHILGLEVGE